MNGTDVLLLIVVAVVIILSIQVAILSRAVANITGHMRKMSSLLIAIGVEIDKMATKR